MNANNYFVSVVIPTRNRPNEIFECLKCLAKQSYTNYEIIVVDSSNNKTTFDLIKIYFPDVKHIYFSNGKSKRPDSKNIGIKNSKGDIIAFLDDDSYAMENWLKYIVEGYSFNDKVGAVGGPEPRPGTVLLNKSLGLEIGKIRNDGTVIANFNVDTKKPIYVEHLRGCNMSFLKIIFNEIGYLTEIIRVQILGRKQTFSFA